MFYQCQTEVEDAINSLSYKPDVLIHLNPSGNISMAGEVTSKIYFAFHLIG